MVAKEHVAHAHTNQNVIKQLECVVMVAILENFTYHLYVKQVTIFYMIHILYDDMLLLYYAYQISWLQVYKCIDCYSTGVDKPDAPTIIFTNETTIWVNVPITWKNEYEKILYSFAIQVIFNIIFYNFLI